MPAPGLVERYRQTRRLTEALCAPLSEADATIQSMDDASPAKWHLAHTTWFFETFLLRDKLPGYRMHDERWAFLFNSYYESEGERIARPRRGMLSRPTVAEIRCWRDHVDMAMEQVLADPACADLVELGIAHEQQHQELLLTDIKHALFQNPLGPAMWTLRGAGTSSSLLTADGEEELSLSVHPEEGPNLKAEGLSRRTGGSEAWHSHPGGIALIGHDEEGFAFDNEGPRHRVLLEPFALAARLVTNGDWDAFIADGGYTTPSLWLSDGWSWIKAEGVSAPLYWRGEKHFTHQGWLARDPHAPVTHISYYEADAFATWAGARLPTEFEWEAVARGQTEPGFAAACGNQLDGAEPPLPRGGDELFGDCWQFTRSAYLPYPRFAPAEGAVGEYNGKFMSGQFVLKGASCATPRGHSRPSYRNFFYPHQRWQFTGLRLAKDL
jgi:ergothioneine biosynthesis protein EgtB